MSSGEKLIVVATLEPVIKGQELERIPPHMTVIGWLAIQASQQHYLYSALERIFKDDYYQNIIGGDAAYYGPDEDIAVRKLINVETAPWTGLHALADSLDGFPEDDQFKDVFSPHVTNMPQRVVEKEERLALPTVAVFSKNGKNSIRRVEEVYPLGKQRTNETAS
jgi:hypothetical protein